jgi:two-component system response regulator LytT
MKIRAMIVEDERLAREELAYLLQQEEDVTLCPSAETGDQLLALYDQYRPNVIFLDMQIPGPSGVEVARRLVAESRDDEVPLFVFTTAYDDYAVEAFELEAVDYLLKPYDEARFKVAMERVRKRMSNAPAAVQTQLREVRLSKLLIEDGERMVVLPPESICYAVRVDRYLEIHTEKETIQSRMTLQELEEKLRGYPFFRTHRSFLVNLDYIQEITPWFNGAWNLILKDGKRSKIPVSRAAAKRLFALLGW